MVITCNNIQWRSDELFVFNLGLLVEAYLSPAVRLLISKNSPAQIKTNISPEPV